MSWWPFKKKKPFRFLREDNADQMTHDDLALQSSVLNDERHPGHERGREGDFEMMTPGNLDDAATTIERDRPFHPRAVEPDD